MPDARQISELCKRGAARLGLVGLLFVGSLLGLVTLYVTRWSPFSLVVCTLVLCVTGIIMLVRGLRYISRHSLWSLRNRLLTVYALIGILPIVLILILVGLGAWSLTSELAIYLASSELDRRLESVRGAAEYLERIPPEERKYAAPEILKAFTMRFPGLALYTTDASGEHSYPPNAAPLNLPPGWKDATGLLDRDGRFYGWSHQVLGDETITALAPLTNDFIADLVPNLGQIVLSDTPHARGGSDTMSLQSPGSNPDFEYSNGKLRSKNGAAAKFAIHNAGQLPPPMNRFDIDVNWIAVYPHYDWTDPNKKYPAILMVRSLAICCVFGDFYRYRSVAHGSARRYCHGRHSLSGCRSYRAGDRRFVVEANHKSCKRIVRGYAEGDLRRFPSPHSRPRQRPGCGINSIVQPDDRQP